jgi:hypothetical protein
MSDVLRSTGSKLRRARRLVVRTELTLSALQATFWIALVGLSVGAVLLVRRRLTPTATDRTDGTDETATPPEAAHT